MAWVTTLSLQTSGRGQVQSSSRRNFAPFASVTEHYTASARARSTAEVWRVGARYIVRGHITQTVLNEKYRNSARLLPLEAKTAVEGSLGRVGNDYNRCEFAPGVSKNRR